MGAGWYAKGTTVSSGAGKRAAYDTLMISRLRFGDASGRWVEYELNPTYAGKTLQSIVSSCMSSNRMNNNSAAWQAGQCSNVGKLTSSHSVSGVSQVLRIGVGDGQNDGSDWALFMPLTGNGSGDYLGNNIWNFGGETKTNNLYAGTVTISATPCTLLFEAKGNSGTYKNIWTGWYTAGAAVSSGAGKRAAYDTLPLARIRFSDASGAFAEYQLNAAYAGQTLQSIVSSCMGSNRNNNNSAAWKAGQCSNVGKLMSSNSVSGVSQTLRIGVGDGSNDQYDWALFMPLTGNGSADYVGNNIWNFGGEDETNNGYTSGNVMISGISSCQNTP